MHDLPCQRSRLHQQHHCAELRDWLPCRAPCKPRRGSPASSHGKGGQHGEHVRMRTTCTLAAGLLCSHKLRPARTADGPLHAGRLHACQRACPARRVARAVSAGGRPSRTDFHVLVGRDTDFSAEASPSLLGPAVPCELTRRGPACACLSPLRERAHPCSRRTTESARKACCHSRLC